MSLGIVAVLLEVYMWTVVLKRKKAHEKGPGGTNGTNGFYGYGGRTQNVV